MIIRSVDVVKVRIPLSRPYVVSRGSSYDFKNLLVRIHGDDGLVGLGETTDFSVVGNIDATRARLENDIIPRIIGMDSFDLETIIMETIAPRSWGDLWATAAIDLALWDLNGKALGVPVYKLLGGLSQKRIPVDYTLSEDVPAGMAAQAVEMAERGGFRAYSVKIGGGNDPDNDVARIKAVREAVGKDARIRADMNEAYDADTAIKVIRAIEPYDVEFAEQPVRAGDLEGLKKVAAAVDIPISIDEGLRFLSDAMALAETGAVKVFNIKVPKVGGLYLSKKIAAVAQAAGISWICGGATALEVIRQASRHFTASTALSPGSFAHEGPGPASQALTGNIARRVIGYDDVRRWGGNVEVSDEPGLGVEVDEESVIKYTV